VKNRFQSVPFKCNVRRYSAGRWRQGRHFSLALLFAGETQLMTDGQYGP
jgi:hypothetical protein